jgi:excisionase family DNA binding protein
MLSMKQAAEYLGVKYDTLAKQYKVWGIPHYRMGPAARTLIQFRVRDLENWLETRRVS